MLEAVFFLLAFSGFFVLLAWIAALLLAWRDRHFPRRPRPRRVRRVPPEWMRQPSSVRLIPLLFYPLGVFALTMYFLVEIPARTWRSVLSGDRR